MSSLFKLVGWSIYIFFSIFILERKAVAAASFPDAEVDQAASSQLSGTSTTAATGDHEERVCEY